MRLRAPVGFVVAFLASSAALAAGRVLDGTPVAAPKAQSSCVSPRGDLPNWDTPAHPECDMVWRTLAEKDGRKLYSARYAWPSPAPSRQPLRVLTEVLFESVPGGRLVKRLYAVQDDEAQVRLAPLRALTIGGQTIIESQVCMSETNECGRELAVWTPGAITAIEDFTVKEIRAQLPKGYDLKEMPSIDIAALTGVGKAWKSNDADCCPSAKIRFKLRLEDRALHVEGLEIEKELKLARDTGPATPGTP